MDNNNGWITDRLPTEEDELPVQGGVLTWDEEIGPYVLRYDLAEPGKPWRSIPHVPPYNKPRWKPKKGEEYWYANRVHIPVLSTIWADDEYDNNSYRIGNCFQTEKEAQGILREVFEKFKQVLKEHHNGK